MYKFSAHFNIISQHLLGHFFLSVVKTELVEISINIPFSAVLKMFFINIIEKLIAC